MAAAARDALDQTALLVDSLEAVQRSVIASLIGLYPTAAWRAAGCTSAKSWLIAYCAQSVHESARLERIAELCVRHPRLATAVTEGRLRLDAAHRLARAVTAERSPHLTDRAIDTLLDLAADLEAFNDALAYWKERVDELLAPRRVQEHSLTISRRLFGGGDLFASLAPVAFENVCAALDAFTQDPDPSDAPYQRTLSERRADGLDDLACFGLTHECEDDETPVCWADPGLRADGGATDDPDDDAVDVAVDVDLDEDDDDTFDGLHPGSELDERLDPANEGLDDLDLFRLRLRKAMAHQRRRATRRIRARSGVTVNVHLDLRTLAGLRDLDDLEDLVHHGEGWTLTRGAAEQHLCDAALVATLFDGKHHVLDANDAAERFNKRQRRAIAARDRHCVFPGCSRQPRHCDTHHLHERHDGGPTITSNGCLLCRFHHRLLHQHEWTLRVDADGRWTARDPHGTDWKGRPATHQDAA